VYHFPGRSRPADAPYQLGDVILLVQIVDEWDGFRCAKPVTQKSRIQSAVINYSPGISGLASTAEKGMCRVGWNGHAKQCQMAALLWRAKMAFVNLEILLLHDSSYERMPLGESSWP
jgi:hypothetical protein